MKRIKYVERFVVCVYENITNKRLLTDVHPENFI